MIDYILFDLDGTLADTGPDLAGALNLLLSEEGREPLPYQTIRPLVSHGGLIMIGSCLGIPVDSMEMQRLHRRFLEIYQSRIAAETDLFRGMDEVLASLEAMALPWGIVTNKPEFLTTPLIAALRLEHRAVCVVSGDTLEYSKPHPAPLLHACQVAGRAPSRSVYIGDARRDIEAGVNAGMRTLVALYGYLGADDRPETWGASGMIHSPAGVLAWLEESRP